MNHNNNNNAKCSINPTAKHDLELQLQCLSNIQRDKQLMGESRHTQACAITKPKPKTTENN